MPREKLPMDLLTTYNHAFIDHSPYTFPEVVPITSEEPRFIAGPFTDYLRIDKAEPPPVPIFYGEKGPPKDDRSWEPPSEYYKPLMERTAKKWPHIKERYLTKPICKPAIRKLLDNYGRSCYHIDLCRKEDGIVTKTTKKRSIGKDAIRLPDDWEIPLTTNGVAYRDPRKLNDYDPRAIPIKRIDFAAEDAKVRRGEPSKIGISEYMGVISRVGGQRLEDFATAKPVPEDFVDCGRMLQKVDISDYL